MSRFRSRKGPKIPDQFAFPPRAKLELGQPLKDWRRERNWKLTFSRQASVIQRNPASSGVLDEVLATHRHETARVHHASRWRGGCVAAPGNSPYFTGHDAP